MKVSCIIPAYNEASRVSNVIDIVLAHDMVAEVIVVNDGSTDNTQEVLKKKKGIILINHPENRGKTQAALTGLQQAKQELVMLIDADLIGLSSDAVADLIRPVLDNQVRVTINIRKNALSLYKMLGIDFVSGERVFNKRLLLDKREQLEKLPGFGLEVFMNQLIIAQKLPIRIITWGEVISPRKSAKIGFFLGSYGDFKMVMQVIATVSLFKCIFQIYMLKKLSRN